MTVGWLPLLVVVLGLVAFVGPSRAQTPAVTPVPLTVERVVEKFLMTALVTGVGLIPLALGAGEPGKEIQQPMAVVILRGIITSVLLNMLVIPALYLRFGRARAAARESDVVLGNVAPAHGD